MKPQTYDELAAERDELLAKVARLTAENERLKMSLVADFSETETVLGKRIAELRAEIKAVRVALGVTGPPTIYDHRTTMEAIASMRRDLARLDALEAK